MLNPKDERLSTGIPGLDEILYGGLLPGRAYLVRGGPGTGKTIMGLHWLMAGVARQERTLYISLVETEAEIRRNAARMGLDLQGISFLDLSPSPEFFSEVETYDIFSPAEVEREPTTKKVIETMDNLKPQRIFIDSMTQFRYLATDIFQFRKQVLSLLRFLLERETTVIFSSETSDVSPDDDLQFIADGVISLESVPGGGMVSVLKYRGSGFRSGCNAMRIDEHGMKVFPRLLPESFVKEFKAETISSGVPELDELLHGGLERGTVTIISGPSGVGKSTLGMAFMKEAAGRGERSVNYIFDEMTETLLHRAESVNIPAKAMIERGTLSVVPVEPLRYLPDEFAQLVRREVEDKQARIVMIDSTAGYSLAVHGQDFVRSLHSLCRYLKNMGVTVILVTETKDITGEFKVTEFGLSYLADNIIFLRYLEINGELHKAIGVLKKRASDFEKSMRELSITSHGIKIGHPLSGLRGILRGVPEFIVPPRQEG
ncbi:MAG: ATPase domain-containing protein [bacterium]|nr:ATPase domain-containing protein [bacterium]